MHTHASRTTQTNPHTQHADSAIYLHYVRHTRRFIHTVTHSLCWDQRYAVFSCALPFFMTLSCQCYLLQTYTQTHTEHPHKLTLLQTHTCILTNLVEAITEPSPSCWLAIKCFPPISQYCVVRLYPFLPEELVWLLPSRLCVHSLHDTQQHKPNNLFVVPAVYWKF